MSVDIGLRYRPTTLVSFATQEFKKQQIVLSRSAINVGIDYVACWNEYRLREERFFAKHNNIFSHKVGFGCWLWKPYIINYELARMLEGAFLMYWDVGRNTYPHRFEQSPQPLLTWCVENGNGILPGVYIPQYGPNKCWTKRDCFVAMDCDYPEYWDHPQVQATFSIWQKKTKTIEFIGEWLNWCERPEVITDEPNRLGLPNFDGFVTHRHDQSVLTNLVIKHKLKCIGDTKTTLSGDKDMNNVIDYVCGAKNRIKNREIRKRLHIRGKKITDPAWWHRNIKRVVSGKILLSWMHSVLRGATASSARTSQPR
jgi:hypothetical protein